MYRNMMRNNMSHNGGCAGNIWVCGHGRKGPEWEEMVMERYKKEVEKCNRLLATLKYSLAVLVDQVLEW
jgi:hypothetical protein